MGGPTQDGIAYMLNLMRRGEEPIGTYHVALISTLPPGFTIGGEELDEPDYPEYYRATLENDSASWVLEGETMSNTVELTFPTADSEWGQINFWALCDQPLELGGRVLYCGQFDEPQWIEAGMQPFMGPGELSIQMSGNQWLMGLQ